MHKSPLPYFKIKQSVKDTMKKDSTKRPTYLLNNAECREDIEWSNFWIDKANSTSSSKRILLVGDSFCRQIRRTLSETLGGIPVDLFATSSGLRDCLFWNQLDDFFTDTVYSYDIIYIQLGFHSRKGEDGRALTDNDYQKFHDNLLILIQYLQNYCKRIIMVSVFHVCFYHKDYKLKYLFKKLLHKYFHIKFSEEQDKETNRILDKKNKIIKDVSIEMELPFCDINALMQNTYYMHRDNMHYEYRANPEICKFLINSANEAYNQFI